MLDYLEIAKINLVKHLAPHMCVGIVLLLITPFIMGVENLDSNRTAQVLEVYVIFIGIILLTPIFLPEQNKYIKDLVSTKMMPPIVIHSIRLIINITFLVLSILLFLVYLKYNNNQFPFNEFYFGTLASVLFLGGLGLITSALFDNIVIAYMIPLVYYIINFGSGSKLVGDFYLFSMMSNQYEQKYYLFFGGIILIIGAILIKHFRLQQKVTAIIHR